MKYILYHELQELMEAYFADTGEMLTFVSAMKRAEEQGIVHEGEPHFVDLAACNLQDPADICRHIDEIAIPYKTSTMELETGRSLHEELIVFKYPSHSKAGIHIQNGLELNYVYAGSCTLYLGAQEYVIRESEVIILPPDTEHDIYPTEDSVVFSFLIHQDLFNETFYQVIRFDTPLATFFHLCLSHKSKPFLHFQLQETSIFLRIFLEMYSEFSSEKSFRYEICVNCIRILFACLLRQPPPRFEHADVSDAQDVINDMPAILHYIHSNYKSISLHALAGFFHYDRSYLGKQIKKYTNQSFSELLTGYRLDHASSLLGNTEDSIENIAEQSGYHSADHFSRMFRQKYGMSPSQYRQKAKDDKDT